MEVLSYFSRDVLTVFTCNRIFLYSSRVSLRSADTRTGGSAGPTARPGFSAELHFDTLIFIYTSYLKGTVRREGHRKVTDKLQTLTTGTHSGLSGSRRQQQSGEAAGSGETVGSGETGSGHSSGKPGSHLETHLMTSQQLL